MTLRIATWNVNSVKTRRERVVGWIGRHKPDALCLQELKTTDEAYPHDAVRETGCESAVFGQKAYNGVALISPHPISNVVRGFSPDAAEPEARLIRATVRDVTVFSAYFPNGRSVDAPAYAGKLEWMGRLLALLETSFDPRDPLVLAGDFNVAPDDSDAQDPERWAGSVLCHADARQALERIREWGFVDIVGKHNPGGGLYSWWDYRRLAFPRNDGLRIDHVFATKPLAEASTGAWVDRDQRKGGKTDKPSDHAPVVADFNV